MQESTLWKLVLLAAIAYLIWTDRPLVVFSEAGGAVGLSLGDLKEGAGASVWTPRAEARKTAQSDKTQVMLSPQERDNNSFAIDPGFARRNNIPRNEAEAGLSQCQEYVARFAPVAVAEMRKFGIPASITLAQALLETNAGESELVRKANNHFGIKCQAKRCPKGHCLNYSDDSHKDFFIKYPNAWGSFRAHSQHLKSKTRYAFLFELSPTDYRGWARGLGQAGYATDKKYAEKLTALIERLDLHRFDAAP